MLLGKKKKLPPELDWKFFDQEKKRLQEEEHPLVNKLGWELAEVLITNPLNYSLSVKSVSETLRVQKKAFACAKHVLKNWLGLDDIK